MSLGNGGNLTFGGSSDFNGSFIGVNPLLVIGARTTYIGHIMVTQLPRSEVEKVLRSGLRLSDLATNPGTATAMHPIIILAGRQTELTWNVPGWPTLPEQNNYNELMLLIPFVTSATGTKWHNYVVRMYLDSADAVTVGNQWWGYQKEMAALTIPAATGTISVSQGCDRKFEATTTAASGLANYSELQKILSMPILATLNPTSNPVDSCSYFVFDWTAAQAQPENVKMSFEKTFLSPAVSNPPSTGMDPWVTRGQLANSPGWAFGIQNVHWQITYAFQCRFN